MAFVGMHLGALRLQVFSKLQNLPVAFFHTNKTGDLMSRVAENDTGNLQTALVGSSTT